MSKALLAAACILLIQQITAQSVWPRPYMLQQGSSVYSLNPSSFQFSLESGQSDILQKAFTRYQSLTFYTIDGRHHPKDLDQEILSATSLSGLNVVVQSLSEDLQFGVDESYSLNVTAPTATLSANTVFGALRGLETFSQLVALNNGAYSIPSAPVLIKDQPRFPHRGMLVDTARHYLPVPVLLRAIDALAYSKFNTFHWHAIDAESFPIESSAFPDLSQGAFSPYETYSTQDIQQVVQYGLERGIRVMPEFDVPGHSASWGKGYPQLTVECPDWDANINNIPLDVTQDFTYEVLQGFLGEMAGLFSENFMHLGGDEVITQCYTDNSTIVQWMNKMGYTNPNQLVQYFEGKLQPMVKNLGKTFVGWQEIFEAYGLTLPPATIIEVWEDETTLLSVAQASLRGILAYGWYLDHLDLTWQDFYANEPFQTSASWTPALQKYIIGGEVCSWSETVDWLSFDSRVWPRAAAAGERLWSQRYINNPTTAQPRLNDFVCVLNRRGIGSAPIQPGPTCFPSSN